MPLSMTGFGAAEGEVAGGVLRVEIRTVNHRYFNLSARLPPDLAAFEVDLRDRLRRDFERGHLAVQIRWASVPTSAVGSLAVNAERAREAVARLRELQLAAGLTGEISLDLIARQPDVFVTSETEISAGQWGELLPIVGDAVKQCRAARQREGEVLAADLRMLLTAIRAESARVAEMAPGRLTRERTRVRQVVTELLDGHPLDEQRLAQEVALLAERLDISEELVRLGAHLDACEEALAAAGPVGKRLGFLAQELGREINTIGSKANDAAMQHAVVAMKGELERFREQLENLE
ncbi:MAG TPA: YicC/YloC family endoribonuclease [Gemmatimonadales bacterium]|nr:YicC/YloC family endoribonuclease [Gemmatimonadales bacterium]